MWCLLLDLPLQSLTVWVRCLYPDIGVSLIKLPIHLPREDIAAFCRRWKVVELSIFASVLTPDFNDDSDIDILVKFAKNARRTLFDVVDMEDELQAILKRKVDLVMKDGISASKNTHRKNAILNNAKVIYSEKAA